ncbi:HIT family protein [Kangiella profundi]|uniref:HIT family protein n=1 Tax=Kangiella profundi TaxID=1561924 RepID=A0A2K9A2A8_9GAMM|nr:HIT domain-containing protein [Kangiella profundi]AUD78005.1 HIT family protein [Kangiella profundi]GGE90714.1 histidine triad (HIT) protein [Kangiella profundi]
MSFILNDTLARDTVELGNFNLCKLLWMNDKQYPWAVLVPRVNDIRELYQLSVAQQINAMEESNFLLETMARVFKADKMNVAALGNMVPQLHIHHIARYQDDPAWPGPIWGVKKPIHYGENELIKEVSPLLAELKGNFGFKEI